jgi:hypothetical protein
MLFCSVMGGGFSNHHLAIWHVLKSDRAQRDILLAAVSEMTPANLPEKVAEEAQWICKQTTALEEDRNNMLHSPIWGTPRGEGKISVQPVVGLGHKRAGNLLGKNLLVEFRRCRDCAVKLRDYTTRLDFAYCRGMPLPNRPQMPNRGQTNKKKTGRSILKAKRTLPG